MRPGTYPAPATAAEPAADAAVVLPGQVYFGWHSPTWGGGIAFYDADSQGQALGRAYLITEGQFADVAAQEMHRAPGEDLDLSTVLEERQHTLGPGRYESLHLVGELERAARAHLHQSRDRRVAAPPAVASPTSRWWPRACARPTSTPTTSSPTTSTSARASARTGPASRSPALASL